MKLNQVHPNCPNCSTHQSVIPFYYGLPTIDQILNAKAGTIALGNAQMWPERPTHTCKRCLTEFNQQGITGKWLNPLFDVQEDEAVAA